MINRLIRLCIVENNYFIYDLKKHIQYKVDGRIYNLTKKVLNLGVEIDISENETKVLKKIGVLYD